MCGIKLSRNTLGDLLWFILASSSQILHSQHIWKVHVWLIDSFAIPANIDKIYTDNICSNLLKISAQNINSPITIQVCCLNHALYLPLRHGAVIQNSCHDFKFYPQKTIDCGLCLNSLLWFGMVHSVLVIVNLVFGICAHILPSCHHPFELIERNLSVLVLVVATKGRMQEVFVPVEFKTFLICLFLHLIYSYILVLS